MVKFVLFIIKPYRVPGSAMLTHIPVDVLRLLIFISTDRSKD
jgi:hypothetical protein